MNKLNKPIIFIGTGRSGTTILSEIIFRHGDLGFNSQYHEVFPWIPQMSFMRRIFENRFWFYAGKKKQLNSVKWFNYFLYKPNEGYKMWDYLCRSFNFSQSYLEDDRLTNEEILKIRDYFTKMLTYQKKHRLVLKLTGPPRIIFLQQIFPDAQFIHLKRDLIPCIYSFLKVDFWKKNGINKLWWKAKLSSEEEDWVEKNRHKDYLLTAFQLKKILNATKKESKKLQPDNFLEVSYENFVDNPSLIVKEILTFTNLNVQDINLNNYFKSVKVVSRNKSNHDYFSESQVGEIEQLILS